MADLHSSEKHLTVNGADLSFSDEGTGDALIFIHGFPFDKNSWRSQADHFKTTHRVITFDLRGFGKSSEGQEVFSIDLFASDLIGLMDALEIKKASVCGLSMGGYIVMNAVSRYPERFGRIILADTQCIADSDEGKAKRYKTITQIEKDGLNQFAEDFVKGVFCKKTLEEKSTVVETIKTTIKNNRVNSVASALKALAERKETCSALKKISIPALVICGKEDTLTPVTQSEFLFNNLENATITVIEEAGHLSNLEQPEEFNSALEKFLQKKSF